MRPMWGRHVHRLNARRPCPPHSGGPRGPGGHGFGIRRPLRFLTHKLDLDPEQTAELARVLDTLKTERAQGRVDDRRARSGLADALVADTLDTTAVRAAADLQVKSSERVRDAVVIAMQQIHAMLRPEQRTQMATLLRSGPLSL